jgi:predicted phage baseplate assembly protein
VTLPIPNLDDRNFEDLVAEAQRLIEKACPEWTDRSVGDPGVVLLEVFAYLTDVMIYRLNRLPDKAYVEFLRLLGVKLLPPVSAVVKLRFSLERPRPEPVQIAQGARVTISRTGGGEQGEPPVFVTGSPAVLKPGELSVDVLAYHCVRVEAEP